MKKYYFPDDTPTMPGYYKIGINHKDLKCLRTLGSYQILEARLLNINFADFLRLCRDSYGAEIYGKGEYYPVPYFKDIRTLQQLCNLLNEHADQAIKMSENQGSAAM